LPHSAETTAPAPVAARRRPLILAAVMLAMFMAAVESTIVATVMPTVVAELGGFDLLSWVFAAYLLTQAVTIPIYGRLADLFGRKPVFFAGAAIFLVGSTLCGLARTMLALVLFRALQGLGAGAIMPLATTIVGDVYPPPERPRIQGWLSSVWGVSAIVGPVLGAFLVRHWSWAVVCGVNLPIGALSIALFARFLRDPATTRRHAIDYLGSALLALGTAAAMLAALQFGRLGGSAASLLGAVAAGALALFLLHERRTAEPMLPLHLFRNRVILGGALGGLTIGAVMMGITAFLPTYVQGPMGGSALTAGFVLTVMSLGWSLTSPLAGRLMLRRSYRFTAAAGGAALVVGSLLLIAMRPTSGPLWAGAGAFVTGVGMGFCNTTFIVAVQASVDWQERGVATSSTLFMRILGQSLGAALFGAVLNAGLAGMGGDAIRELMARQVAGGDLGRLAEGVAAALRHVYWLAGGLSLTALLLAFLLPARLGAASGR
jgi:EmrB/QacA subfamily drug resistance transporter